MKQWKGFAWVEDRDALSHRHSGESHIERKSISKKVQIGEKKRTERGRHFLSINFYSLSVMKTPCFGDNAKGVGCGLASGCDSGLG